MRKTILPVLLSMCIAALPITAYAEDDLLKRIEALEQRVQTLEEQAGIAKSEVAADETDFIYEKDGFTYKYLKHEVLDSYLYVYFEFTNGSDKNIIPYYALMCAGYQNGVSINSYMPMDQNAEPKEAFMTFKEIQPGTTVDIAIKYQIEDMSDVTVELHPMVTLRNEEPASFTISLD